MDKWYKKEIKQWRKSRFYVKSSERYSITLIYWCFKLYFDITFDEEKRTFTLEFLQIESSGSICFHHCNSLLTKYGYEYFENHEITSLLRGAIKHIVKDGILPQNPYACLIRLLTINSVEDSLTTYFHNRSI